MNEKKSLDILGIKPIGDAVNTTVSKAFQGLEGFLKSVCAPALDEIGLMFKDHVRHWRLKNILNILEKSKGKLKFEDGELKMHVHPRVALSIIENGSLSDSDVIQDLWAGLFASSCTESGQEDENIIFVSILNQLTTVEAKILNYACSDSRKIIHSNGLVKSDKIFIKFEDLRKVAGVDDMHKLDRYLDHLSSMNIIVGGFPLEGQELTAEIRPTPLALNLFIRCQGFNGSVAEFWKDDLVIYEEDRAERRGKLLNKIPIININEFWEGAGNKQ
jgi:hypothetical protein